MKVEVDLGPQLNSFVQAQLTSGRYKDANEVMREALRLLEARELRVQHFRNAIEAGDNSGEPRPWNKANFLQQAHQKADEKGIPK